MFHIFVCDLTAVLYKLFLRIMKSWQHQICARFTSDVCGKKNPQLCQEHRKHDVSIL